MAQNHNRLSGAPLRRLIREEADDPAFWASLTHEDAQGLRGRMQAAVRRDTLLVCAFLVALIALVPAALLILQSDVGSGQRDLLLFSLLALAAVMVVALGVAESGLANARELFLQFEPLQAHEAHCLEAVRLLKFYDVKTFRDQVIAQGRELLEGDYWCMRALADSERQGQEMSPQQACRILHALEPSSAAN